MQIFQASAPETDGAFLHAGYLSAYDNHDVVAAATSTGVTPSTPANNAALFDLNIPLILLFFAGLILLRSARAMPPLRRRLATAVIVCLAVVGLMFPAISSAYDYITTLPVATDDGAAGVYHYSVRDNPAAGVRDGR